MSKRAHTPGTWKVAIGERFCFHQGNRVSIWREWEEDGETLEETIAEVWPMPGTDTDIADGFLMGAAPDMLEALRLRAALEDADADPIDSRWKALRRMERAAIAKAEGML